MMDTGLMTYNMEKVLKHGETQINLKQLILATFLKEKRMVKEDSSGMMALTMRATLLMVILWVMGNTTLQILINIMKENLDLVIQKEEELRFGQMDGNMMGILRMDEKMEKETLNGQMVSNTQVVGEMESSMVQGFYTMHKKTQRSKVNGAMVKE